jgi:hypothetical protein
MARFLLILLAAALPAQHRERPAFPPPVPLPRPVPVPAINSEAFQRQLVAEQRAALMKAARTHRNVTRSFAVGWEMHHGLYLVPSEAKDWLAAEWYAPDFLDHGLRDRFANAASDGQTLSAHIGQKLVCRCTGVAWSFYGEKRFLIRSGELAWQ